jgi:DNA-binding response OmpR family regulator
MVDLKILFVDDNPYELKSFEYFFSNYNVTTCIDPEIACKKVLETKTFNIIITDIFMKNMSGLELFQMIKSSPKNKDAYIIACTGASNNTLTSVITELGFDEIIEKPVNMEILDLKFKTIMKKFLGINSKNIYFREDNNNYTFSLKGESIPFTYKEYEIMKILVDNQGEMVSHEQLFKALYGNKERSGNIIKSHIKNIRNKIALFDPQTEYIKTIHLKGYLLIK